MCYFAPQVFTENPDTVIDLGDHKYSDLGLLFLLAYAAWLLYLFFKKALDLPTARSAFIAASTFLVCALIAIRVHHGYQENRIRTIQIGPEYLIVKNQSAASTERVVMRYEIKAIKSRSQGKQNCYLEIELTDGKTLSTNPVEADRNCNQLRARISNLEGR